MFFFSKASSPVRTKSLLAICVVLLSLHQCAIAHTGLPSIFGSNMVLQQAPAAAAVYGVAPEGATAVKVTVSDSKGGSYDVVAKVGKDATHQPTAYVDPKGAPLPVANFTWKVGWTPP